MWLLFLRSRPQHMATRNTKKLGKYNTTKGTQYISSNQAPEMEIYELSDTEFKIITLEKFTEFPENTSNSIKSGKQSMNKVQQTDRNHKKEPHRIRFPIKFLFLPWKQPPSCSALTGPCFCVHVERERELSGVSSFSYKDISSVRLGPHPYDFM